MKQSLREIADLAEELGNEYYFRGKVNAKKLARAKGIQFIKGQYGSNFLGQLVHYSDKFYILLNSDLLSTSESGRVRFTIAHELGHFFIDEHRTSLSKGISLSYYGNEGIGRSKNIEFEANHFAANLLLPKGRFIKLARKLDPGLSGILSLKTKFDTSIESTAVHYITQDITPSLMIRWNKDFIFRYASYSKSFSQLLQLTGYPSIRFDVEYLKGKVKLIGNGGYDFIESATLMSKWLSNIAPGTSKDFLGLEQIIKLGEFGGIIFLTF